jgi:D-hexose-6-phosphate mutarotase
VTDQLIEIASGAGRARISRKGAQAIGAEFDGRPLLWLAPSGEAQVGAPGKAIRGGVPVCFPWFGPHPDGLPQHGFARNLPWELVDLGPDRAEFALCDDDSTRSMWPHAFRLESTVSIADRLDFAVALTNTGADPFTVTYALHSYLAVPAVASTKVEGLDGCVRHETGSEPARQIGPVTLGAPIDATFDDVPVRLTVPSAGIAIEAANMPSAVVWNPGAEAAPSDVGDAWPEFVCVERGCIGAFAVTLDPEERHAAAMTLSFHPPGY